MKDWVIGIIAVILALFVIATVIFPRVPGPDPRKVTAGWREQLYEANALAHSASDIKRVRITMRESRWSLCRTRWLDDTKDTRAIWAALRKLDPTTLRMGPRDDALQLVLENGGSVCFRGIDWDYDSEFTRAVKACWKRGKPV